jgi:hypothetical protein
MGQEASRVSDVALRQSSLSFFVEASTGERFLAYFPEDEVEWRDEGLRYGGLTYGSGDSIVLGGGTSSASRPVPSDCRERFEALTQWIVAQSDQPTGGSAVLSSTRPPGPTLSP